MSANISSRVAAALNRHSDVVEGGLTRSTSLLPIGDGALAYELVPTDASAVGLILCPSFFELKTLQASELRFGEQLARGGMYAMYLQPSGTGESFGEPEDVRIASRIDAAVSAAHRAVENGRCERIVFFGCRLGGAVAVSAAQRFDAASFAVWDPVVEGAAYLKQARRLDRIAAMAGRRKRYSSLEDQLRERGWATLLGNVVTQEIYDDLDGWTIGQGTAVPADSLVLCLDDGSLAAAVGRLAPIAPALTRLSLGRRHLGHLGFTPDDAAASTPLTIEWLKGSQKA